MTQKAGSTDFSSCVTIARLAACSQTPRTYRSAHGAHVNRAAVAMALVLRSKGMRATDRREAARLRPTGRCGLHVTGRWALVAQRLAANALHGEH